MFLPQANVPDTRHALIPLICSGICPSMRIKRIQANSRTTARQKMHSAQHQGQKRGASARPR